RVRGLFSDDVPLQSLRARLMDAGYPEPSIDRVDDRDWENAWRQHVPPRRYGGRLWVLPSDAETGPEHGVCVRLDPGLAFGTGAHPTTALMLEWLDGNVEPGASLIDYGCGSGILAIAAAKLGAARVRAVDNDPMALQTARDNARDNDCLDRITFHDPESVPREGADLLVSNIFADPLISLFASFEGLVRPRGRIALSGILADQLGAVAEVYAQGFELAPVLDRDRWILLSGRKRAAPA
ncbi:MAG: 50S ribosomal protein L11 methyltransferase, partial [Gammaproteobacteria bacterium]|nr:50S ribosomal protein L11 methyltransferase [Gammaproteobacteria bacterium]